MKKLITYITLVASAVVLSTSAAQAQSHRGHGSSHQVHPSSNYTTSYQKVFSHYDRHGHAIYTYRKVIVRKSSSYHRSHHNSHYKHQPQRPQRPSTHTKAKSHRH